MLTDREQLALLMTKEKKTRWRYEQAAYWLFALLWVIASIIATQGFKFRPFFSPRDTEMLQLLFLAAYLVFCVMPGLIVQSSISSEYKDLRLEFLLLAGFSIKNIFASKLTRRFLPLGVAAFCGVFIFCVMTNPFLRNPPFYVPKQVFSALFATFVLSFWFFSLVYSSAFLGAAFSAIYRYSRGAASIWFVVGSIMVPIAGLACAGIFFPPSYGDLDFWLTANEPAKLSFTSELILIALASCSAFSANFFISRAIFHYSLRRAERGDFGG